MSDPLTPSEYYGWKYSSTTRDMCKPWPPLPCHSINSKEEQAMGRIKKKARKRHIGGTDVITLILIRTESLLKIPQTPHFPKELCASLHFVSQTSMVCRWTWETWMKISTSFSSHLYILFLITCYLYLPLLPLHHNYYPHQLGIWREKPWLFWISLSGGARRTI